MISFSNQSISMSAQLEATAKEIPLYSWRKIKTNPFNQGLHPRMFNPQGYTIRKPMKLKGSSAYDKAEDCYIRYDREFVREKLASVFEPLVDAGFESELIIHECRNAIASIQADKPVVTDEQIQSETVLSESDDTATELKEVLT